MLSSNTISFSPAAIVSGDIHWINSSGGNWSNPLNWNPTVVPTASDRVYIDASGTYTVNIDILASALNVEVGNGISGVQTLSIPSAQALMTSPGLPATVNTSCSPPSGPCASMPLALSRRNR